jgi:hypothetical protein
MQTFLMLMQVVHVFSRHRVWSVLLANIYVLLEHKVTSYIPVFLILLSGSSVSIANGYGLEGSGIESRWGRDFPHLPERALGPPSILCNGCGVFPGCKAAGAWRWPPTPSGAGVKERVELYLYFPSGPSWVVLGGTLFCYCVISCYWMPLRKREDPGNWKRKHYIALSGEIVLEDVVDVSYDRLRDDDEDDIYRSLISA